MRPTRACSPTASRERCYSYSRPHHLRRARVSTISCGSTTHLRIRNSARQEPQQREEALTAVINQSLPAALKQAIVDRAERLVAEYQENELKQRQTRAALEALTAKARSVFAVLTEPNLDPTRWQEPAVLGAFRRALAILVKKAVVRKGDTRLAYCVELTLTKDP
ncbi:MAG: hypothetical protein IPK17_22430, partial [Chloroflexi bacterium]|uniref:hypothetical protein n=1 Tax=Candidatus Flexifilum breve TaxID=3140694 RepID=UPI003134E013|nr:hypothetical protein [Chloroflexota bacterium]